MVSPDGVLIIDTPGMREVQLWADEAEVAANLYPGLRDALLQLAVLAPKIAVLDEIDADDVFVVSGRLRLGLTRERARRLSARV